MFITQCYGTILGAFINYAVMIAIVTGNSEILVKGNGDSSWSGATIQAYNTNAASWALSKYLYRTGTPYEIVPIGLAIGAGAVVVHRVVVHVRIYYPPIPYLISFPPSSHIILISRRTPSSSPRFETSHSRISIFPNSSNTPATSPTTRAKPASSGASFQLDSSSNITSGTTIRGSSRIIRI